MVDKELDSFIEKFKQLWKKGAGAHLDLDAHDGQAWVGLRVRLGQPPGPHLLQPQHPSNSRLRTRNNPSRQRRRARRAAARQEAAKETEAEKVTETEVIENVTDNENQEENILEKSSDEVNGTIAEKAFTNSEEIDSLGTEKTSQDKPAEEVVTTENLTENIAVKEFVTIEATAIVEDSPNDTLANDELESIYRYIASKDHLIKNIADAKAQHLSSREFRNFKYKHTVGVKIIVRTANLWEGARSYIWRHLGGDNTWTRGNGTRITLVKIHQE